MSEGRRSKEGSTGVGGTTGRAPSSNRASTRSASTRTATKRGFRLSRTAQTYLLGTLAGIAAILTAGILSGHPIFAPFSRAADSVIGSYLPNEQRNKIFGDQAAINRVGNQLNFRELSWQRKLWIVVVDPPLPDLLAPLPHVFRLLALIVFAPLVVISMIDFAGYVVFRTLGYHRRRVRVRRTSNPLSPSAGGTVQRSFSRPPTHKSSRSSFKPGTAPLLSPGAYDATTLLQHRARRLSNGGIGKDQADAHWDETGGAFARVRNVSRNKSFEGAEGLKEEVAEYEEAVRASSAATLSSKAADAAAAAASGAAPSASAAAIDGILSPTSEGEGEGESTGYFGRANDIGVEGALGLADTDVEDSGFESNRSSPSHSRSSSRDRNAATGANSRIRGGSLGGTGFLITPLETGARGRDEEQKHTAASSTQHVRDPSVASSSTSSTSASASSSWVGLTNSGGELDTSTTRKPAAQSAVPASLLLPPSDSSRTITASDVAVAADLGGDIDMSHLQHPAPLPSPGVHVDL